MKKHFLHIIIALGLALTMQAQTTVPNGSFELFQNFSQASEEPTNWNSNKTGGGLASYGPQTCFHDTSTLNGGTYCVKMVTATYFGTPVNGSCTTGKIEAPSATRTEGYIHTIPNDANFSSPFTGRPDSIAFWYRYTKAGSDNGSVEVRLHTGNAYAPEAPVNSNHPDSSVNIVARATWASPAANQATWKRISVPFTYVGASTRIPQYILVTMTSTQSQTSGSAGSTMWIDEMVAIYNPTLTTGTVAAGPYYVSATQGSTVTVPFTMLGAFTAGNTVTAQLSDASGSFASPVAIGSVTATASGAITATIPAGTLTGTGYRIRVVSSTPAITAADNGANITINLCSNSITAAAQTIAANTNGTAIAVTETPTSTTREWKYATVSGGPYSSFGTAQTGGSYTPNFATAGTYYIVCVSTYPSGLTVTSNEVTVHVVSNSIAPTTSQSLLVGVSGTILTVTETPTGTSRTWKYATTSGGPYSGFGTAQTGTTYTPLFASAGTYYVVCQSMISGVTVTSNEVIISVGNATITTSAVTGSPFLFSPSAPNASVSVGYITSGTFNAGNIFTAQLSDASGSFSTPVAIGTHTATTSGTISATIPHTTAAGTGYRIRVVSSNPVVLGSDNGTNLTVDQFHNSAAPTTAQNLALNTAGTAVTVTASQTATQVWQYSTVSGSGYTGFSPAETGTSYTPQFAAPGTYYVVAKSINQYHDTAVSSEVTIIVNNGTVLSTSAVTGSPFEISPKANVQVTVNYTSDAVYSNGNVFTAQLSDATGSFAAPVVLGSVTATTPTAITAQVPNSSLDGTGYRIRVISTSPALTGTDNGTDLTITNFGISVTPSAAQNIYTNHDGAPITITENQTATREWTYAGNSGGYMSFTPAETGATYTPNFATAGSYYIVCTSVNSWQDSITSLIINVNVTDSTTTHVGINDVNQSTAKLFWSGNNVIVDLSNADLSGTSLQVMNMSGQVVLTAPLKEREITIVPADVASGVYIYRIVSSEKAIAGKMIKP